MLKKKMIDLKLAVDSQNSSFGRTYFVMKSTDTRYQDFLREHEPYLDGTPKVYTSILSANSNLAPGDTIRIGAGDWDEGAVIPITVANVKILGPNGHANRHVAMILSDSASHHLMTINAHNVEVAYLGFTQTKDTYDAIQCSTTASYFKIWIHDCRFDGYGQGEYGVHSGTTYDSPDLVIEKCKFVSWQTAAIYHYATRGRVSENFIITVAGAIGIHLPATTSDRGGQEVWGNRILGVNSTDTGISVGAVDAGMLYLCDNRVVGCATTISQFANGQYSGALNYTSDTGGGNTLIDIDS